MLESILSPSTAMREPWLGLTAPRESQDADGRIALVIVNAEKRLVMIEFDPVP